MRAARLHGFGDPSVLRVDEVPDPARPRGTQILVRVGASSVNGTDLLLRQGRMKVATLGCAPFVPGFDIAGEVVACGPAVTAFAVGDPVMALLDHGGGGQAEQVLLPQRRAARAPRSVPVEQAAALPLAGLTALQALRGRAALHSRGSRRVLVNGASGGIGSYGVQLAKLLGAHVTAIGSGDRLAYLRELGADEVVDRHRQDVTRSRERWDVVLDAPGVLPFRAVRHLLTRDGVLVSTRPLSLDALRALAARPLGRTGPRLATVMTSGSSQDLSHLAHLVDTGRLRPVVDRTFGLDDVAQAHRHAEGGVRGKVVVAVAR